MTKKVIILIFYSKLETCHPSIGKMHCFNNWLFAFNVFFSSIDWLWLSRFVFWKKNVYSQV